MSFVRNLFWGAQQNAPALPAPQGPSELDQSVERASSGVFQSRMEMAPPPPPEDYEVVEHSDAAGMRQKRPAPEFFRAVMDRESVQGVEDLGMVAGDAINVLRGLRASRDATWRNYVFGLSTSQAQHSDALTIWDSVLAEGCAGSLLLKGRLLTKLRDDMGLDFSVLHDGDAVLVEGSWRDLQATREELFKAIGQDQTPSVLPDIVKACLGIKRAGKRFFAKEMTSEDNPVPAIAGGIAERRKMLSAWRDGVGQRLADFKERREEAKHVQSKTDQADREDAAACMKLLQETVLLQVHVERFRPLADTLRATNVPGGELDVAIREADAIIELSQATVGEFVNKLGIDGTAKLFPGAHLLAERTGRAAQAGFRRLLELLSSPQTRMLR